MLDVFNQFNCFVNLIFYFMQPKCARYWPEPIEPLNDDKNCFETYGLYQVKFINIKNFNNDYVLREFSITENKTKQSRSVYQFQYLAWSDHGVPENQSNTLEFIEHFNHLHAQLNNKKPITVVSLHF